MCSECGSFYMNFCLHCKKADLDERVWELLDRFGLNEEELIRILAAHVNGGSFPALNLAVTLKDMKPASRSEVSINDNEDLRGAKDRINNLLSKLVDRRRQE